MYIFPFTVNHKTFAFRIGNPVSAGFVDFKSNGETNFYGRSESLKLDSRPTKDKKIFDLQTNPYI